MTSDQFRRQYALLRAVGGGTVQTYEAHRADDARSVLVHWLGAGDTSEVTRLRDRVLSLPEPACDHVAAMFDVDGASVVVTEPLAHFESFERWLDVAETAPRDQGSLEITGACAAVDPRPAIADATSRGADEAAPTDEPGDFTRLLAATGSSTTNLGRQATPVSPEPLDEPSRMHRRVDAVAREGASAPRTDGSPPPSFTQFLEAHDVHDAMVDGDRAARHVRVFPSSRGGATPGALPDSVPGAPRPDSGAVPLSLTALFAAVHPDEGESPSGSPAGLDDSGAGTPPSAPLPNMPAPGPPPAEQTQAALPDFGAAPPQPAWRPASATGLPSVRRTDAGPLPPYAPGGPVFDEPAAHPSEGVPPMAAPRFTLPDWALGAPSDIAIDRAAPPPGAESPPSVAGRWETSIPAATYGTGSSRDAAEGSHASPPSSSGIAPAGGPQRSWVWLAIVLNVVCIAAIGLVLYFRGSVPPTPPRARLPIEQTR